MSARIRLFKSSGFADSKMGVDRGSKRAHKVIFNRVREVSDKWALTPLEVVGILEELKKGVNSDEQRLMQAQKEIRETLEDLRNSGVSETVIMGALTTQQLIEWREITKQAERIQG